MISSLRVALASDPSICQTTKTGLVVLTRARRAVERLRGEKITATRFRKACGGGPTARVLVGRRYLAAFKVGVPALLRP